jgi:GDP-L-fucose synthase
MFVGNRILVTGAAGFIGVNLLKRLLQTDAVAIRGTLHVRDAVLTDPRIEYVRGDLTTPDACAAACADMDYVFICSAVTSGAAVMANTPLCHLTPNLVMNARLLEAAYAARVKKTLFVSSNTVYPVSDKAMAEGDCTNEFYEKYHIVAWMKRFSEIMCEMYARRVRQPMATIVVRPANAYGPYDKFDWETSHVLPALIRRVVERHNPMVIWGDGKDIKDFIYVEDLVDGMVRAMDTIEGYDEVNLASGEGYCLRDILALLLKLEGFESAQVTYDASKPTMIPKRLIDPAKARQLLGFSATTSIEDGLRRTLAWYKSTRP